MKLWISSDEPAPEGWVRVRSLAEAQSRWRGGPVREAMLAGPPALAEAVAGALEQDAFTGRSRPMVVGLQLPEGAERAACERSLANAARHWAAMSPEVRPSRQPAGRAPVLARFLLWHVAGFAIAVVAVEVWMLLRHGQHAPILRWLLPG